MPVWGHAPRQALQHLRLQAVPPCALGPAPGCSDAWILHGSCMDPARLSCCWQRLMEPGETLWGFYANECLQIISSRLSGSFCLCFAKAVRSLYLVAIFQYNDL